MGIETDISWCDSSINLMMGCDGCELWLPSIRRCYAGTLTERYGGRNGWPESFDKPKLFLNRLEEAMIKWPDLTGTERPGKPWLNGLPRVIFLNDMGDTFTESLPLDWLDKPFGPMQCPKGHRSPIVQFVRDPDFPRQPVITCSRCVREWPALSALEMMARSPHIYLLLTKRPKRMGRFFQGRTIPKNVWLGVSVTSGSNIDRIWELLEIPGAPVYFLSYEPALGAISLNAIEALFKNWRNETTIGRYLDWTIIGGESGHGARVCDVGWLRGVMYECLDTETPVFVKQLGSNPVALSSNSRDPFANDKEFLARRKDPKGSNWLEWPEELRVRQMPRIK